MSSLRWDGRRPDESSGAHPCHGGGIHRFFAGFRRCGRMDQDIRAAERTSQSGSRGRGGERHHAETDEASRDPRVAGEYVEYRDHRRPVAGPFGAYDTQFLNGSFLAMGSTISWWARSESGAQVAAWFEVVEDCCSRFNPDSELSSLNRDPQEEIPVSALLGEVLEAGDRAYSLSRGLVDPTVLEAVAAAGYDRDFSSARRRPAATPGRVEGWDRVRVQGDRVVRPPGVGIDLGGIAKGWTAERALELIDGPARRRRRHRGSRPMDDRRSAHG